MLPYERNQFHWTLFALREVLYIERTDTVFSDIKECLEAFQAIDTQGQTIIGIIVALIVGGIITLFMLVALLPNAPIAVNVLVAIGGALAGRASK